MHVSQYLAEEFGQDDKGFFYEDVEVTIDVQYEKYTEHLQDQLTTWITDDDPDVIKIAPTTTVDQADV